MTHTTQQGEFAVLWPLARKVELPGSTARALTDLSGKTICEIWDYLFRGELIFPTIRELLRARYPGIKFVEYPAFGNIHGPKRRDIVSGLADKLRALGCDAVICGIGA
jgi:hypothetical protein